MKQLLDPHSRQIIALCCTHYPLATQVFYEVLGNDVRLFDPAAALAERIVREYDDQLKGEGKTTVLLSAESKTFHQHYKNLFSARMNFDVIGSTTIIII